MNNTNKQLLIDAAKSVGIIGKYENSTDTYGFTTIGITGKNIEGYIWNPLEKDEDAFRLMVDLKFMVDTDSDEYDNVSVDVVSLSGETLSAIPFGDDRMSATRRAITTAAAEIYRSGKCQQPQNN